MEFSRPEYWSGQSFPSPGYETMLYHSLLLSHQGPHISLPLLLLLPLHGQSTYYPHPNSHFSFETHCRCHFFGHFHTTPLPAPTTCNLVILSFGLSLSKNFDSLPVWPLLLKAAKVVLIKKKKNDLKILSLVPSFVLQLELDPNALYHGPAWPVPSHLSDTLTRSISLASLHLILAFFLFGVNI